MKMLLAVIAMIFLIAPDSSASGTPGDSATCKAEESCMPVVARSFRARIIALSIRKGMTSEQMPRLLRGKASLTFLPKKTDGSFDLVELWVVECYFDEHLIIYWSADKEGVLRVDHILFTNASL
jgi:hypothetical protein